jgi:hypothetical protein
LRVAVTGNIAVKNITNENEPLATLGDVTKIVMILSLSHVNVDGVITLNFDSGNTSLRVKASLMAP